MVAVEVATGRGGGRAGFGAESLDGTNGSAIAFQDASCRDHVAPAQFLKQADRVIAAGEKGSQLMQTMRVRAILTFVSCVVTSALATAQPIPAFPGADGAAAYASGGRANGSGQIVYHVTKLDSAIDDPERFDFGTLRYGLNNSNFPAGVPRTIVFDVGGVFNLGRLPQAGWDPNGNGWDAQSRLTIGGTNVTFAGQTAPGAGVIFMGGGL